MTTTIDNTLVFIKPEGERRRIYIINDLCRISAIKCQWSVRLDSRMLDGIYPGVPAIVRAAINDHLLGRTVEVIGLEGDDIVSRAANLIGTHFDPEKCGPNSLRRRLWNMGGPMPMILEDGVTNYYYNFVHRARTDEESGIQTLAILKS